MHLPLKTNHVLTPLTFGSQLACHDGDGWVGPLICFLRMVPANMQSLRDWKYISEGSVSRINGVVCS